MSDEKNLARTPSATKPVYCGVGSCDNLPGHDGIHRCRCGQPVNEPANGCGWHRTPIKVGDLVDLKPEVMFGPIGPPLTVTRITRNWLYARREGRLAVAVQVRIGDVTLANAADGASS